jgi:hypothetical protein
LWVLTSHFTQKRPTSESAKTAIDGDMVIEWSTGIYSLLKKIFDY